MLMSVCEDGDMQRAEIIEVPPPTLDGTDVRQQAEMRTIRTLAAQAVRVRGLSVPELLQAIEGERNPGVLCDVTASALLSRLEDKQALLEYMNVDERMKLLLEKLADEIQIGELEERIHARVQEYMDKANHEYYLREQIRAIQEELGGGESSEDEAAEWRKTLKKLKLDPAVTKKIEKEIDQFTKMPGNSPEASVVRSYVEAVLDLPWNKSDKTEESIVRAQEVLDEDHYGMTKVKDRILEYLAVQTLSGSNNKAPILCLVGPPGVGKTSIARSVARATGRKFVHMSLGGVRDEAEIRGHRRTYIGAIPGRIMTLLRECGSNNPVFLFDEVDKIGADFRGDPASALLEVLDPEQNK